MFSYFRKKKEEKAWQEAWPAEKERLNCFSQKLLSLGEFPQVANAFHYAVRFFQIVSDFQDVGSIYNAPEEFAETQCIFNRHIYNAGRNDHGINRTKRGETVTLENTYWGGVFGLFTKNGQEWSDCSSVYHGFSSQWLEDPSQYDADPEIRKVLVDFQVKPFIESHLPKMLELCDKLLAT